MDFVTIPTATFRVLYCLFIVHHDCRRILHFNVTANPTSAWVHQQLCEVFFDDPHIKHVIHDRDGKFSGVAKWLKSAGAKSVLTSYRSPWQNGIAERWALTLGRAIFHALIPRSFQEAPGMGVHQVRPSGVLMRRLAPTTPSRLTKMALTNFASHSLICLVDQRGSNSHPEKCSSIT